jgi:hypothetical protein
MTPTFQQRGRGLGRFCWRLLQGVFCVGGVFEALLALRCQRWSRVPMAMGHEFKRRS